MKKKLVSFSIFVAFQCFIFSQNQSLYGYSEDSICTTLRAKTIPRALKVSVHRICKVTKVPILLPSIIPTHFLLLGRNLIGVSDNPSILDKNTYSLELGIMTKCPINRNCVFFYMTGELITDQTIRGYREYQEFTSLKQRLYEQDCKKVSIPCSPLTKENGEVILSRQIKGIYIPKYGGEFAKVIWEQGKYQYSVTIFEENSKAKVINFANSLIENQF